MPEEDRRIGHLVVDSGGFIKNAPIDRLCANAYTIPEVVAEIRDKQTKARLKILPYELKFRLIIKSAFLTNQKSVNSPKKFFDQFKLSKLFQKFFQPIKTQ